METAEIIARIKDIVTPYSKDTNALANINEKSNFISDLKINSANLVDIILDVEEAFDIEIDNDAMEKMLTVGSSIEIVQTNLPIMVGNDIVDLIQAKKESNWQRKGWLNKLFHTRRARTHYAISGNRKNDMAAVEYEGSRI